MFRTIKWYFKFIFLMFINYPCLKKAEKLLKNNEIEKFYNYCFSQTSNWAMNRIKDSGATINVYGKENIPEDKNVVFISNHQGDFDIAIFMALIPKEKGFVAKIELQKFPVLRTWMKYLGCVFMDRNDLKQSLKTINQAIKFIKDGHSMVIFPEGTRSKSDKIGEFKAGSFKLATKTNTPIVPVTIDGSYKLKEKNKGMIKPDTVNVYIHSPIYLENMSNEEKEDLPNKVKHIIEEKLPKTV
ncbi:lysophospholipid acyltransferase family protein [[Clostridium] colinum]|uniref:lysophospholipid acyltransferase family protein n=1 Tax=[Clostridium] colinum TaxID=36835 RepID=UPI002025A281|nr:lysophospholipid acyltransferase family protein [[Clostridium] colinum]